jgi:hypothetical protein
LSATRARRDGIGPARASVLVALLLLTTALAGCLGDGDDDDEAVVVTITFLTPELVPRTEGQDTVWDATVAVGRVSASDHGDVPWTDLWATVLDHTGHVVLLNAPFLADGGTYGGDVEVWYADSTGGRDTMDEGDAIRVTSMNLTLEGGNVRIFNVGGLAGSFPLPVDFP